VTLVEPTGRVTEQAAVSQRVGAGLTAVRRFQVVCVAATALAAIPYLWVLWDMWSGTLHPLRLHGSDDNPIYDVQARALMHGHLWIPNGSISTEAFVSHGHQYTYFGIFPSLLRVPIFAFTNSFDGRLTAPSILASWITTALFCSLLLWRLRTVLGAKATLGWIEAGSYGVLLVSILVGSTLVFLAASDDVYAEDLAWSVALACASLFAILGVVERPSWGRLAVCGLFVLCTNLNRSTTGYAAIFATVSVSIWFATGRAGPERRRWALPMALAGLVPLAVGCAVDLAKFGLLFGAPLTDQLVYKEFHLGRNGGQYFSLRNVPATLHAYVDPLTFRVRSTFPYVVLSDPPDSAGLVETGSTSNALLSMPLLFAAGVVGVVVPFRRGQSVSVRALRFLLVAMALCAGVIMIYGWITERFVADFLPLLILSSMIGLIELWRWVPGRSKKIRAGLVAGTILLAMVGVLANLGYSVTPDRSWSHTQLTSYLHAQQDLSDITGHPLNHTIVTGDNFPRPATLGTLFIKGNCQALYVALETVPKSLTPLSIPSLAWMLVERAPQTSLCRSLLGGTRVGSDHEGG
jgi:hypothetical protein